MGSVYNAMSVQAVRPVRHMHCMTKLMLLLAVSIFMMTIALLLPSASSSLLPLISQREPGSKGSRSANGRRDVNLPTIGEDYGDWKPTPTFGGSQSGPIPHSELQQSSLDPQNSKV